MKLRDAALLHENLITMSHEFGLSGMERVKGMLPLVFRHSTNNQGELYHFVSLKGTAYWDYL